MVERLDVEFQSEGTTVRGWLYVADESNRSPAVVLAGGWCYVREIVMPVYAKAFAEAGDEGDPEALAALIYILHMRDRIKIPFDDIDLDFKNFSMEPTEQEIKDMEAAIAELEDPKEEAEQDETLTPSGPTSEAD